MAPPLSVYGDVWLARRGCVCCPCEASPPWHPSWTTLPLSESRTNLMGSPVSMTQLCVGSTFALAPRILGPLHECSTAYCAACLICLLNPQPLSLSCALLSLHQARRVASVRYPQDAPRHPPARPGPRVPQLLPEAARPAGAAGGEDGVCGAAVCTAAAGARVHGAASLRPGGRTPALYFRASSQHYVPQACRLSS